MKIFRFQCGSFHFRKGIYLPFPKRNVSGYFLSMYIHSLTHTYRPTAKNMIYDSGGIKTCKSIKISFSKYLAQKQYILYSIWVRERKKLQIVLKEQTLTNCLHLREYVHTDVEIVIVTTRCFRTYRKNSVLQMRPNQICNSGSKFMRQRTTNSFLILER